MKISNQPSWSDVKLKRNYPQLKGNITTDVVIIGGGITGVVTAYLLSKTKVNTILVERDEISSGATAMTTAFITQDIDTDLTSLVEEIGYKQAKLVWQSGREAIDLIEEISGSENIDCEFTRCPAYDFANTSLDLEDLEQDFRYAKKMGFDVNFTDQNDLNFLNAGYLEIKGQAKFHPVKFVTSLAKKASRNGVKIFEGSEALKVSENMVKTKGGVINTKWVVIATHLPFNEPYELFLKKGKYVSYIMELKIPQGVLKEGIYMDQQIPYHYFRIDKNKGFDRMIIGGEDHRSELNFSSKTSYQNLERHIKETLPALKYKITRQWAGPIIEPSDGLALLGKINDSTLVATGHSGNGMTYGIIAAMIFKDIIEGQKNPYLKLYDPKRVPTPKQLIDKGIDYSKEFINIAVAHTISKPNKR